MTFTTYIHSERVITNMISSIHDKNKFFVSSQNYVILYDLTTASGGTTIKPIHKYQFESEVLDFQLIGDAIICGMRNGHVKFLDTRQPSKKKASKNTVITTPEVTPLSNPSSGFGAIGGNRKNTGSTLAKSGLSKRRVVVATRNKDNTENIVAREQTKFLSVNAVQVSSSGSLLFVGTATGHCNVLDTRYVNALVCNPVKSVYIPDMIRRFEKTNSGNKCRQNLFQNNDPLAIGGPPAPRRNVPQNNNDDNLMVIDDENELLDNRHSLAMRNRFNDYDYSRLESKYHPVTSLTMDPYDSNLLAFTTGNGYVGYISDLQRDQPVLQKLYKYSNIIPNVYLNSVNAGDIERPRPCFLTDFGSGKNCFFCVPNRDKMVDKNVDNNYVTIFDWSLRGAEEIFKEEIDLNTMSRTIETNSGSLRGTMLVNPERQQPQIPHAMNETVCVVQDSNTGLIMCAGSNDTIVTLGSY
jgi:hypothetical protein